jgi:hypothetical protein
MQHDYTRQAVYIQSKNEARSHNHCYRGETISIKYHVCVCNLTLVIRHVMRMRLAILPTVACSAVDIVLNLMAHGDAREGKLRGNRRMEWVISALPLYLGTRSIQHYYLLPADPHSSTASTRLN